MLSFERQFEILPSFNIWGAETEPLQSKTF